VTGWEGEDLSVPEKARRVLDKLTAAGVGQRPVVFVTHSMGGLVVKEMLSVSLDEARAGGPRARLASATRGVVFFATPHFGSHLASLGLKLRHVPGAARAPAPAVHHLAPGPHLEVLNERLRALHDAGKGGGGAEGGVRGGGGGVCVWRRCAAPHVRESRLPAGRARPCRTANSSPADDHHQPRRAQPQTPHPPPRRQATSRC
jgi:hypothetical protein